MALEQITEDLRVYDYKVRINVEELWGIFARLSQIGSLELDKIDWYENDKKLEIDQEVIDDFKFTGLNNRDFIGTGQYKMRKEDL